MLNFPLKYSLGSGKKKAETGYCRHVVLRIVVSSRGMEGRMAAEVYYPLVCVLNKTQKYVQLSISYSPKNSR